MLKLVSAQWVGDSRISLAFSDGKQGIFDFEGLLSKEAALTVPLRNPQVFKRFFLELGALCWPNGMAFSASRLHRELDALGKLRGGALTPATEYDRWVWTKVQASREDPRKPIPDEEWQSVRAEQLARRQMP